MRRFVVLVGVLLALMLPAPFVAAQDASPPAGPPGGELPEGCSVIASGLANPRFVTVGEDGTVYVTDAGVGGDEVVTPPGAEEPPQAATPEEELADEPSPEAEASPADEAGDEPPLTRGPSGQVVMVSPEGEQSVLADGLLSYGFVGPHGITLLDGQLYVAVGGAAASLGVEEAPMENSVVRIDPETGETEVVVELGSYEIENNPDGEDINPNLYGIAAGDDGQLYVADAGSNVIYRVDPESGEFDLVELVPNLTGLTGGTPEPSLAAAGEEGAGGPQSVPTDVTFDDEGLLHIALLSTMWPPDAPSIITLEDGTFTGVANGLAEVVSIAVGPDGALYASQLTTDFAQEIPAPGNVLRVLEDGSTEVAVDGIFLSHGIDFDAEGNLYVVANSVAFGPGEPAGTVLRCEGVAGGEAASARDAA